MIEIYIDKQLLDLDQSTVAAITLGIGSIETPGENSTAFTKSIKLPMTPNNRRIMGHSGEVLNKKMFNSGIKQEDGSVKPHTARIDVDNFTVMTGMAQLKDVTTTDNGDGYYDMNFIGEEFKWVSSAKTSLLCDTPLSENFELTQMSVIDGLRDKQFPCTRFFPVDKGGLYMPSYLDPEKIVLRDNVSLKDLVPFLNVKKMLENIFARHGYTVVSSFFDTPEFKSLYFSGEWPLIDSSEMGDQQGFYAASSAYSELTLNADDLNLIYQGNDRYYVDEMALGRKFSKGRLLRYALVHSADESNDMVNDLYNYGNSFKYNSSTQIATFTPQEDCFVSFTYYIAYISKFFVPNEWNPEKKSFLFFDTVELDGKKVKVNYDVSFSSVWLDIPARANHKYLLNMWAKSDNPMYDAPPFVTMQWMRDGQRIGDVITVGEQRDVIISTGSDAGYDGARLQIALDGVTFYPTPLVFTCWITEIPNEEDFAVTIETEPVFVAKGQAYELKTPTFSSSKHGVYADNLLFKLKRNCTVEAKFHDGPGFEKEIDSRQVINAEHTQMDFISAIRQMFNLYFYTNNITKQVFIEPRESFYNDHVVDWTDKLDYTKEILIEDTIQNKKVRFSYMDGDDVVKEYNKKNKTDLGNFTEDIANAYATDDEIYELQNNLFAPSVISESKCWKGMKVIKAAETKSQDTLDDIEVNISGRIVQLTPAKVYKDFTILGLNLPDAIHGVSFYDPAEKINLGFDNHGLARYYDTNIRHYNQGKRITAYVKLEPKDIEPMLLPHDPRLDLRAAYKIRINGEDVVCRIESIVDYDPASFASTKCIFVKEVKQIEPTVSFDISELRSGAEATSLTVEMKSNSNWSIGELPEWIAVSPMSGAGDTTLTVTTAKNAGAERTHNLKIDADSQDKRITKELTVVQEICPFTADVASIAFSKSHLMQTINLSGVLEGGYYWDTGMIDEFANVEFGETSFTVEVYEKFYTHENKTLVLYRREDNRSLGISISVDIPVLMATTNIKVPRTANSTGRIQLTCNNPCTIISNDAWITPSITSNSATTANGKWFNISVTANSGAERSGTLRIDSGGLYLIVTIIQAAGAVDLLDSATLWFDMDKAAVNQLTMNSRTGNTTSPLLSFKNDYNPTFTGPASFGSDSYGRYAQFSTLKSGCALDLSAYEGSVFTFIIRQNIMSYSNATGLGSWIFSNTVNRGSGAAGTMPLVMQKWENNDSFLFWPGSAMVGPTSGMSVLGYQNLIIRSNGSVVQAYRQTSSGLTLIGSSSQNLRIGKGVWNLDKTTCTYYLYIQPWGDLSLNSKVYDIVFYNKSLSDSELATVFSLLQTKA